MCNINDITLTQRLKPILDTSGSNYAEYMSGTYNMVGKSANEIEEYCEEVDLKMKENDIKYQLPSKFKFTGGMVFISNMRADQIEQAIMSRSIFIDIHLAQQDVLKRINAIMRASVKSSNEYSEQDVDEVMESLSGGSAPGPYEEVTYMTPEYARKHKKVTVRAAQLALILKKSGLSNWADLAAKYA